MYNRLGNVYARINIWKDWRNKTDMNSKDFESNLKNLKGTFAIENMSINQYSINNLKKIDSGILSYTDVRGNPSFCVNL